MVDVCLVHPHLRRNDMIRVVQLNSQLEFLKTQLVTTQPTTAFNHVVRLRNIIAQKHKLQQIECLQHDMLDRLDSSKEFTLSLIHI